MLEYNDAETAQVVADAVSPDNRTAPTGLVVTSKRENCVVVTEITLEGKLATLIATIDDLLENASTAEKTLTALRK
jgi:hypothetical protein